MSSKLGVLGCGSWGTALAIQLARNGNEVRLWGRDQQAIERLSHERVNARYLPGVNFPDNLYPVASLEAALEHCDGCLLAVPSKAVSSVLNACSQWLPETGVLSATKGFDPVRGQMLHEVVADILGAHYPFAALSGPSFAREVGLGMPTACSIASTQASFARQWAYWLHSDGFLPYMSEDVVGVELCGAAKNIIAIACGISDGMGFGSNARAALITRGLAEITRLGLSLGGQPETFLGLSGVGDLVLTCTDDQSRNRRFGLMLAEGASFDEAKTRIGQVVEGCNAAQHVWHYAGVYQVRMPITEQIHALLTNQTNVQKAAEHLIRARYRQEFS